MEIRQRVQIVPWGYEKKRILEPIMQLKADKVVLLKHGSGYDAGYGVSEALEENERIEVEIRECDIFDIEDSLEAMVGAIVDHRRDDVFVNITTGSKITAIAGMIACQSMGATPFYVKPAYRGEDGKREPPKEEFLSEVDEIYELPVYRIAGPSREQLEVLHYLREQGTVTKKDLIEFGKDRELPFIIESQSSSDEGYYRRLESHIIDPLDERGDIALTKSGRRMQVDLTEEGAATLLAFPRD